MSLVVQGLRDRMCVVKQTGGPCRIEAGRRRPVDGRLARQGIGAQAVVPPALRQLLEGLIRRERGIE